MASPLPPAMTVLEFVRQILRLLVAVAPSPYIHIYLKTARAMNTSMWMIQRLRFNHLLFDAILLWLHLSVCIYVASSWVKKAVHTREEKAGIRCITPPSPRIQCWVSDLVKPAGEKTQTFKQHSHWGRGRTDEMRKTQFPLLPPVHGHHFFN